MPRAEAGPPAAGRPDRHPPPRARTRPGPVRHRHADPRAAETVHVHAHPRLQREVDQIAARQDEEMRRGPAATAPATPAGRDRADGAQRTDLDPAGDLPRPEPDRGPADPRDPRPRGVRPAAEARLEPEPQVLVGRRHLPPAPVLPGRLARALRLQHRAALRPVRPVPVVSRSTTRGSRSSATRSRSRSSRSACSPPRSRSCPTT